MVSFEITVGRENLPVIPETDRADEHVNRTCSNSRPSTVVADSSCLLVVEGIEPKIREGSQIITDSSKLRFLTNARKYLLADWAEKHCPPLLNNFIQLLREKLVGPGQAYGSSTQC